MQDSIFLTGGSGFIGRPLLSFLRQHNYKVFALVRSKAAAAVVRERGAYAVPGNLYNHTALKNVMELCHYVVHAAAFRQFWGNVKEFYTTNVEGTKALLDAAVETGIRKFIYISDASVIRGRVMDAVDETFTPQRLPHDLYSETKYQAERAVINANSERMLTIAVRPPFVWGPENPHIEIIRDLLDKKLFRWIDGGRQSLSTCHVENLAAGILAALENGAGGNVYYITDGEYCAFKDFFSAYMKMLGVELGDKSIPRWLALAAASVFEFYWKKRKLPGVSPLSSAIVHLLGTTITVSDQKARQQLHYRNILTIDEGLKRLHNPRLN